MEPIKNFEQLLEAAKQHPDRGIAVVLPHDKNTLLAVRDAVESGLARPRLYGDRTTMETAAEQISFDLSTVDVYDIPNSSEATQAAIQSVRKKENHILMKGSISTGALLKAALDKATGLNIGRLASHLVVLDAPCFDSLIISTDGGLNIAPTLAEKADMADLQYKCNR